MRKLLAVFLLLSLVSLTADIVYEGGRSISGTFLDHLGAPAIAAGVLALGEFLGYSIRLPMGMAISAKRCSRFLWLTVVLGYALVVSIPLLALVLDWRLALALYLVERLGKGLRAPARDVLIADVTDKVIGRGKAFGIHELLDQVGALLGPLVISYAITYRGSYSDAYAMLLPAALASIALVLVASMLYPQVNSLNNATVKPVTATVSGHRMKRYMVFVALLSFGLVHWGLVSYHLSRSGAVPQKSIPLFYALAMLVDALIAVPLGAIYDRYGVRVLAALPLISVPLAPLLFLSSDAFALLIAAILYGVLLCSYDSVLRAAVADMSLAHERAIGFGWLGFVWGISWGLGNVLGGLLYDLLGLEVLCVVYPAINLIAFLYVVKSI